MNVWKGGVYWTWKAAAGMKGWRVTMRLGAWGESTHSKFYELTWGNPLLCKVIFQRDANQFSFFWLFVQVFKLFNNLYFKDTFPPSLVKLIVSFSSIILRLYVYIIYNIYTHIHAHTHICTHTYIHMHTTCWAHVLCLCVYVSGLTAL